MFVYLSGSPNHQTVIMSIYKQYRYIYIVQGDYTFRELFTYLTQCARIRVPLVVMKIEKFKDLFRAALDRWWDSHESKNFGASRTRWPIQPIFSAILPILGKI